MEVKSRSAE